VVKPAPATRRVVVGPRGAVETHRLTLRDVNWLGDEMFDQLPRRGIPVLARVRSTREPVAATLEPTPEGAAVRLSEGEGGIAAGQACVFYDAAGSGRVLGGGWIARTESRWQAGDATAPALSAAGL
jgi:tRNA-uridine 2-sulfurtransferase